MRRYSNGASQALSAIAVISLESIEQACLPDGHYFSKRHLWHDRRPARDLTNPDDREQCNEMIDRRFSDD